MKTGVQTIMKEAGEAGCYLLDLVHVAELRLKREINALTAVYLAIDGKYIHYNKDDQNDSDNFYVEKPEEFLKALTGDEWTVRKETADYIPAEDEFAIQQWGRKFTGGYTAHFRMKNWDPLESSLTVQYGKIESQRVCRIMTKEA